MSPPALNMEDPKYAVSSGNTQSTDGQEGSVEVRFADFCKNGLLNENACTEAMKLFNRSKHLLSTSMSAIGSGMPEEAERYWFAFVLYSVKRLSQSDTDENSFNICKILRVAKLNMVDFFKELPQFIVKAGPILSSQHGADWEKRLEAKELQANFEHLSLLSKYYKHTFQDLFLISEVNSGEQLGVTNAAAIVADYHRFGWLLFWHSVSMHSAALKT